jgi:hypothetical protein
VPGTTLRRHIDLRRSEEGREPCFDCIALRSIALQVPWFSPHQEHDTAASYAGHNNEGSRSPMLMGKTAFTSNLHGRRVRNEPGRIL